MKWRNELSPNNCRQGCTATSAFNHFIQNLLTMSGEPVTHPEIVHSNVDLEIQMLALRRANSIWTKNRCNSLLVWGYFDIIFDFNERFGPSWQFYYSDNPLMTPAPPQYLPHILIKVGNNRHIIIVKE